jgi:phage baseplate assembly protein gpV
MLTTKRLSAFLGLAFLVACASSGDRATTQAFNDGSRIEYSAAGHPVRFTDSGGQQFATNPWLLVEQVFDDGSAIEYSAAGNPVRVTDTSGKVYGNKPRQVIALRR